jgi:cytochrome c oxidase cbb3-type subunit 4
MAIIHSVWTVIVFLFFIGVVAWAYDRRRKPAFDAAARIPLDDDNDELNSEEKRHG